MFDVKHIYYNNNLAYITGYFDEEENLLNEVLSKQAATGSTPKEALGNWQLLHLFVAGPLIFQYDFRIAIIDWPSFKNQQTGPLPSLSLSVPTPPPLR